MWYAVCVDIGRWPQVKLIVSSDIPEEGLAMDSVLGLADKYDAYGKFAIAEGRVSGAVYTDRSPEHITLLTKVTTPFQQTQQ